MKHDVVLINVRSVVKGSNCQGEVFHDSNGTHKSGDVIWTPPVDEIIESGRKTYLKTCSSTYRVDSWS